MEIALRRRLAGVDDVSISQREQTTAVTFVPGTPIFSASEFRRAIAEADVTVLTVDVDVCGTIEAGNVLRASPEAGASTLQLLAPSALVAGAACITGRLKDEREPYQVEVIRWHPST